MLFLNGFRFGTLLFNVCISQSPCMADSNLTISGQNLTNTIALISPSHPLGTPSLSASQMSHSPVAIRRRIFNSTSIVPTASTSASSTSSEVTVPTYGPKPSENHIAKLAEMICPSILIPGLGFYALKHYEPKIAEYIERVAGENGERNPEVYWRAFAQATRLDKGLPKAQAAARRWLIWMERMFLNGQARDNSLFSKKQVNRITEFENALERGDRIWDGLVRLIPASGSKLSVD